MKIHSFLLFVALAALLSPGCGRENYLTYNGRSDYRIVISDKASPSTVHGANELQSFLRQMTGADIPIVGEAIPMTDHEIIIGDNSHLRQLNEQIDFAGLGDEGYVLKNHGKHLIIAGGALRGNMYGVYGLLEDHLGCRWFTPEVSRIPQYKKLGIPVLDERVVPALEYREPYIWDAKDGDWAARNRINRNTFEGGLAERHGGQIEWVPGFFVHTFERLVPKAKYYDTHPEYFSLVAGKRMKEYSQLCCTNEDVFAIVTEGVLRAFRENPQAKILALDQNDCYNYCECKKCQALTEREGSQMAPVLDLVNRVADEVKKEFPDRAIVTLAYQWTRHAPKTIRPRDNVIIRLCSIECCFTHPFDRCDSENNKLFTRDLEDWSKISNRLWVWNYTTDFSHYLLPFPNLRVRKKNLNLFVNNHVTGMFQQDTPNIPHGELSELGAYLHAKLLWNPQYDDNLAINEFLEAYYGPAAPQIRVYIDFIHDKAEKENIHMGCYEPPETALLSGNFFAFADSIWNEAEKAVSGSPEYLERVQASRLSPEYAWVARDINDKAYVVDQTNLTVGINADYMKKLDDFCAKAEKFGVKYLNESGLTTAQFKQRIADNIKTQRLSYLEPVKTGALVPGAAWKYYESGWDTTPMFGRVRPKKTGVSEQFLLPETGPTEIFGMVYEGYIEIPKDGVYSFYTFSDDGTVLYIDGNVIVDNGGRHAMQEKIGFAALRKGMHSVKLTYFNGAGGLGLDVFCKGPDMDKQRIPAPMIRHKK
ncbi:DUF4838 domain-containing protein [bacterium]|nr:DUF4838 domain-containing protein [bacterium]